MTENPKELKAQALNTLSRLLDRQSNQLRRIDNRLLDYYVGLKNESVHNLYEILGGIRFLRVLRTYPFNHKRVSHAIRLYEGLWRDGEYVEGSGGLQFSGLQGFTHYQMQPWQVFTTAGLFGPHKNIDGDLRRLCQELVLFLTRKSGKTQFAAFVMFYGFFFMDSNFEGYCCANSSDQAKLLYKTAQQLIRQMDPSEKRIRFTASQTNWKTGQPRIASMTALSAGGKTKDGLFAQLCCADEFGSADFTNGKSDMKDLVSVVQSSMGPRREPLTVITTTAGMAANGPFRQQLDIIQQTLEEELTYSDDYHEPTLNDYQHCLLLQPDPWEQIDEDALLSDPNIWRKSNPMIGISVQPQFYEQEAFKARQNPDNRKEFITKLVNVYQSSRTVTWIKAEEIRPLQTERRIDDCKAQDGWVVFCGMDFSKGDDLHAISYLAARRNPEHGGVDLFADLDSWMTEHSIHQSSVRELWEQWVRQGWLHVSRGKVLQSSLPVERIAQLIQSGVQFQAFGYDSYQSLDPINTLKAYLSSALSIQRPEQYVVPVSQTYASYNPAVLAIENAVRSDPPLITFSPSPLWPFEFGNCKVDEDLRMNNRKMIKAQPGSDACKIDNVQCLASAILLEMRFEGSAINE